jgi:hypothetical protein
LRRGAALDLLAVGRDRVRRVRQHAVGSDAAVDRVGLAVARVDHVVADRHRAALEQPAVGAGLVAVDRVAAGTAGYRVVAEASLEAIVAGSPVDRLDRVRAGDDVVPAERADRRRAVVQVRPHVDHVGRVGGDERAGHVRLEALDVAHVVALAGAAVIGGAVERERDRRVEVAGGDAPALDLVVARAAVDQVGGGRVEAVAVEHVVAGADVQFVAAALTVDRVVAPPRSAVTLGTKPVLSSRFVTESSPP